MTKALYPVLVILTLIFHQSYQSISNPEHICEKLDLNKFGLCGKNEYFCTTDPVIIDANSVSNTTLASCVGDTENLVNGRFRQGTSPRSGVHILPTWMNLTLAQEGQRFAKRNLIASGLSSFYGLFAIMIIPDGYKALMFTHNTDNYKEGGMKRYIATIIQINLWYEAMLTETDYTKDEALDAWARSIMNVRKIHLKAAQAAAKHGLPLYPPAKYKKVKLDKPFWNAVRRDFAESKIPNIYRDYPRAYKVSDGQTEKIKPMNQFIFSMTQFSLVAYPVIRPNATYFWNVHLHDEGLKGFVHLWAIIGYALGIDDEFNICLKPNMEEIRDYFEDIHNKFFTPPMFQLSNEAKILLEVIFKVVHENIPTYHIAENLLKQSNLGHVLFMHFVRDVYKIKVDNMQDQASFGEGIAEGVFNRYLLPQTKKPILMMTLGSVLKAKLKVFVKQYFGLTNPNLMEQAQKILYYPPDYV